MAYRNGTNTLGVNEAISSLKRLGSDERIVAGLYFYEGLTISEIALVLEQSTQQVQQYLRNIFSVILPEDVASPPTLLKQRVEASRADG